MKPTDSLLRGGTWGRVLTGLALVGACTVVDKGDYTFTDVPDDSGGESGSSNGGSAGSSSGKGGQGGTAGEAGDGNGGTTTGGTSGEAGGGGAGGDGGLCEPNPCENGGTCIQSGTTTRCECAAGYEGVTCGVEIDECDPNPCMNNLPCTDHVADFSCACPPPVTGKTCDLPRFQPIPAPPVVPNQPTMARAVSADGTIVLGAVNGMVGTIGVSRPFIWTAEGGSRLVPLPSAIRTDVTVTPWSLSGDGTFWVGEYRSSSSTTAPPTPYGGPTEPGGENMPLPGFMLPAAAIGGFAFDTNHDGSRSVGNFTDTAVRAIQWNANGMSLPLMNPYGNASPYASAGGITRDGSIAAGSAKDGMGSVFVVFWGEAGTTPPGQVRTLTGLQDVEVHAVNEDARVTAGTYWDSAYSNFAFLTDGSRFVPLTPMGAPVPPRSQAFDVSDDGAFVVGEISGAMAGMTGQQAVIWKADGSFRPVMDVLRDSNAAPPGWTLLVAYGISADGKVVVGSATDPGGIAQGFIARLP
jgi:uncharacterized membrane protein